MYGKFPIFSRILASDAMLFAAAAIFFILMAMYKSLLLMFLDKNHVLGCIGWPNFMNM